MQYADYDFYSNIYLGNAITPEDFPRLSMRASSYIRGMTHGLSDQVPERDQNALQMATCAVSEVIQDEQRLSAQSFSGEKPIASESVGSYSVSYASPAMSGAQAEYITERKREALLIYLSDVPALSSLFKVRSFPCTHRTR